MGDQRAEAIANMEAMGFERSQIDAAMRAAFFNPDRAVEYLLNVSTDYGGLTMFDGECRLTHTRGSPKTCNRSSDPLLQPPNPLVLLRTQLPFPLPVATTRAP